MLRVVLVLVCVSAAAAQLTCSAGREERQGVCRDCRAGYFKTTAGTSSCTPCPAGTSQQFEGAETECTLCGPGTFAKEAADGCTPCDKSSYSAASGASQCTPCPEGGTTGKFGALSASECGCGAGYYQVGSSASSCAPCQEGSVCLGGKQSPIALQGYWVDPDDASVVVACRPAAACTGGVVNASNTGCAVGYEDRSCAKCAAGNFSQYPGDACTPCPLGEAWGIVCLVALLLVAWLVAYLVLIHARQPQLGAVYVLITFCQILASFSDVRVVFDQPLPVIFTWMSLFNANPDLYGFECLIPWGYRWAIIIASPFLVLGMLALIYLSTNKCCANGPHVPRPPAYSLGQHFKHAYLIFMLFSQIYLTRASLEIFDCTDVQGTFWLDSAPYVQCFAGDWFIMVGFAVLGIVFFAFGIPFAVLYYTLRTRHVPVAEKPEQVAFLYARFKPDRHWWECCTAVVKVMVMVFLKFLSLRPEVSIALSATLLTVYFIALVYFQPHQTPLTNRLELVSTGMLWFIILCMLVMHFTKVFDPAAVNTVTLVTTIAIAVVVVGGLAVSGIEIYNIKHPSSDDSDESEDLEALVPGQQQQQQQQQQQHADSGAPPPLQQKDQEMQPVEPLPPLVSK